MTYTVFKWNGALPYRSRKERDRSVLLRKSEKQYSCPYPWDRMKPGDFFYIDVDIQNKKALRNERTKVYMSAKKHQIFVRCFVGPTINVNGIQKFGLKIIHDGPVF